MSGLLTPGYLGCISYSRLRHFPMVNEVSVLIYGEGDVSNVPVERAIPLIRDTQSRTPVSRAGLLFSKELRLLMFG